jgi:hypothetical protein
MDEYAVVSKDPSVVLSLQVRDIAGTQGIDEFARFKIHPLLPSSGSRKLERPDAY